MWVRVPRESPHVPLVQRIEYSPTKRKTGVRFFHGIPHTPVVQRIEQRSSKPPIRVRFSFGVPYGSLVQLAGYRTFNPGDVGSSLTGITTCSCSPMGRGIRFKPCIVLVRIQSGVPMPGDTQAAREQLAKLSGRATGAGVRISLPRPHCGVLQR